MTNHQKVSEIKENSTSNVEDNASQTVPSTINQSNDPPKPKPPKPEDKPFKAFLEEDLIPGLESALKAKGQSLQKILLVKGQRPVVRYECWSIQGILSSDRRFWISFSKESITSVKTIALAEAGSEASLLESFLIDERKVTLSLIISRVLQRLNGQKWLGKN